MNAEFAKPVAPGPLLRLKTELPDLAYTLDRQGRRDAADVVMQVYARLCELDAGKPDAEPAHIIAL
jgi:hypothetical protein